jgi:hypothetical protein
MDNKELYHNYSKIESNIELIQSREMEYLWMLKIKREKKVYRKKVIIEKYLKYD